MSSATERHMAPNSNQDFDFFYEGLENKKVLIQRCDSCEELRNPPTPMCGKCHSLDWTPVAMSGAGTIFSFTVHHHPPIPGFDMPHGVGVIDLDEGVRFVGALDGIKVEEISIGMRVKVEFLNRNDVPSLRFVPKDI